MTAVVMWPSGGFLGGALNSNISASLNSFAGDIWVLGASEQSSVIGMALSPHWPVEANGRAISMSLSRHYSDDLYHRIHITPREAALGNIASEQILPATVWNAWLVPKTLASIGTENADGILITGQPPAPITMAPLQSLVWSIRVGLDGPPTIAAKIEWTFAGGETVPLHITGSRLLAFPFLPDWAEGISERLEWMTEIMSSPTVREQRRSLRLSPRRSFSVSMIIDGSERQYFDMLIFGWGSRTWALPVWHDIQMTTATRAIGDMSVPCSTSGREFVAGGIALLRGSTAWDVEVVEIDSVEATKINLARPLTMTWPRGSRIYPAVIGRLEQRPNQVRITDTIDSVSATFQLTEASDSVAAVLPTTYLGWPVLETPPDESVDLSRAWERMILTLDNRTGIPVRTDPAGRPFLLQAHQFMLHGRDEHTAHRALLYYLRGRQKALWVPSFADDLTVTATIVNTSPVLTVRSIGYAKFGITSTARRDIRIELRNGTVFHRHIVAAAIFDAKTELLEMDSVLPQTITIDQVRRISFMALCRLDQDSIEIMHETDADGVGQSQLLFRGVKDDV